MAMGVSTSKNDMLGVDGNMILGSGDVIKVTVHEDLYHMVQLLVGNVTKMTYCYWGNNRTTRRLRMRWLNDMTVCWDM